MSQGFTDWTDLGIFPLQDVEEGVPTGMRHALAGARVEAMPDPGSGGDITPTFGRENELGTLGDVHPWLFWQTKDREKRASGSWSQAWAGLVTTAAKPDGRYAGTPAEVQPLTNRDKDVVNDIRYATLEPSWQKGLPMRVAGQMQMVMPSVDEAKPGSLLVHADPRLVASNVEGPGEAGTLVVDLQGEGELCMGKSDTPGKGGRHARLQSLLRVISLGQNAGVGAAPLNGLAINYALSEQDKILGLGMIYAKLESGGGGPKTGGRSTPLPPTIPGPITGPRGSGFAAGFKSGGSKSGGAASGGGTFGKANAGAGGEDDDELTPVDFGDFKKKPQGGHGIGLNARVGGHGPITIGAGKGDKHYIGDDEDGHPLTSSHLSTGSLFFRDADYDGPLLFEGEFPKDVKEHKIKTHVHLSWDRSIQHDWLKGSKVGKWRWWTTVPYVSPTKIPNGDVPPTTKPPSPPGPGAPGPTTPAPTGPGPGAPGGRPTTPAPTAPGGPRPTGPVRPGPGPGRSWTTTGTPGAPGAPRPAGPKTPGPGAPGAPKPQDSQPGGPTTPGPRAPGAPPPGGPPPPGGGGGDGELGQDDGRFLGDDSIVPVGAHGQPGRGTIKRGLELEPLGDHDYREAGEPVGVVNKIGQDRRGRDVGVYSIFHPYSEGFAALGFRPQLTLKGAPNFEHNPNLSATVLELEELTRPTVLTARAWGAQNDSGDWSYTDRPEVSRARGGHAADGVFYSPPEFELADYLGVNPTDTDAPSSVAWVAHAPGVRVGFGTPTTDGSMSEGSTVISVAAAAAPLQVGQVIADKTVTAILEASLFGTEGFVDFKGTGSLKLPVGTTAERPSVSVDGEFRYNSTTGGLEYYSSGWTAVGGGGVTTFVALTDTPAGYGASGDVVTTDGAGTLQYETPITSAGAAGALVRTDGGGMLDSFITPTALPNFIDLGDTPAAYATHAGKLLRVNATPDAVEFVDGDTLYMPTADVFRKDGTVAMTAAFNGGGFKVTNIAAGAVAGDAVEVVQAVTVFVAKTGSTMAGDLVHNDNVGGVYGTGSDAKVSYDGTDLVIKPDVVGTGAVKIDGPLELWDNDPARFGTGQDATILYDGTNLILDPQVVGTGHVDLRGDLMVNDGYSTTTTERNANVTVWTDKAFGMELRGVGTAPALAIFGRSTDTDAIHFGVYPANSTAQSAFVQRMVMTAAGGFGVGVTAPAAGKVDASGGFADNGTAGIDSGGTFQWFDRDSGQHDVTISGGLVTEWTYTP